MKNVQHMRTWIDVAVFVFVTAVLTSCATPRPIATLPIRIVDGNPITVAKIGEKQIDLIVDTGGFGSIAIAPGDLTKLDAEFTGSYVKRTDSAGSSFDSREFTIPNLTLGGVNFGAVQGYERLSSKSGFAGGDPINILGRAFLRQYVVIVNYPEKRFELFDGTLGPLLCGCNITPLTQNMDEQFQLKLTTDLGEMLALMDTGATYSFIQSALMEKYNIETNDGTFTTDLLKIGSRNHGPLELVALPINGAPDIDVFIGSNFFLNHKVCFDYPNNAVAILE